MVDEPKSDDKLFFILQKAKLEIRWFKNGLYDRLYVISHLLKFVGTKIYEIEIRKLREAVRFSRCGAAYL